MGDGTVDSRKLRLYREIIRLLRKAGFGDRFIECFRRNRSLFFNTDFADEADPDNLKVSSVWNLEEYVPLIVREDVPDTHGIVIDPRTDDVFEVTEYDIYSIDFEYEFMYNIKTREEIYWTVNGYVDEVQDSKHFAYILTTDGYMVECYILYNTLYVRFTEDVADIPEDIYNKLVDTIANHVEDIAMLVRGVPSKKFTEIGTVSGIELEEVIGRIQQISASRDTIIVAVPDMDNTKLYIEAKRLDPSLIRILTTKII